MGYRLVEGKAQLCNDGSLCYVVGNAAPADLMRRRQCCAPAGAGRKRAGCMLRDCLMNTKVGNGSVEAEKATARIEDG